VAGRAKRVFFGTGTFSYLMTLGRQRFRFWESAQANIEYVTYKKGAAVGYLIRSSIPAKAWS